MCFWRKAKTLRQLASIEMLKKIHTAVSFKKQIFKAFFADAGFYQHRCCSDRAEVESPNREGQTKRQGYLHPAGYLPFDAC